MEPPWLVDAVICRLSVVGDMCYTQYPGGRCVEIRPSWCILKGEIPASMAVFAAVGNTQKAVTVSTIHGGKISAHHAILQELCRIAPRLLARLSEYFCKKALCLHPAGCWKHVLPLWEELCLPGDSVKFYLCHNCIFFVYSIMSGCRGLEPRARPGYLTPRRVCALSGRILLN